MSIQTLTELRDKVQAGDISHFDFIKAFPGEGIRGHREWQNPWSACHGSLDAAKALHEAVLPGWEVDAIWQHSSYQPRPGKWQCRLRTASGLGQCVGDDYWGGEDCPARAWLLAIMSALIAQGDTHTPAEGGTHDQ